MKKILILALIVACQNLFSDSIDDYHFDKNSKLQEALKKHDAETFKKLFDIEINELNQKFNSFDTEKQKSIISEFQNLKLIAQETNTEIEENAPEIYKEPIPKSLLIYGALSFCALSWNGPIVIIVPALVALQYFGLRECGNFLAKRNINTIKNNSQKILDTINEQKLGENTKLDKVSKKDEFSN